MEKDKSTPEEKLLDLIENPTAQAKKQFKPPFKRKASFQIQSLISGFRGIWLKKGVQALTLKAVNKLLIAAAIIVSLFLIFDFVIGKKDIRSLYLMAQSLIPSDIVKSDNVSDVLPLPDYLEEVKRRDIFVSRQTETPAYETEEENTLASLTENLVLVGILWSGNPQAMIEDTALNKTHVLSKGDTVKGILIKDILRDKVILNYKGRDMEMM